jgi:hypothetical protein
MARFFKVGLLGAVIASGVAAPVLAVRAASSVDPDLKPPTLLTPARSSVVTAGSPIVFRIRTHARDRFLWLNVSRSRARHKCGVIGHDVAWEQFVATGRAGVYQAKPHYSDFPSLWMNTPGTYYWQAHRIAGRDGCVESAISVLRIAPKAPLPVIDARLEGRFDMTARVTSANGLGHVGETDDVTFTFTPTCSTGACDVRLSFGVETGFGTQSESVTMLLTRSAEGYAGTTQAKLSSCGLSVNRVTGTLEIQLNIAEGAWAGKVWQAKRLVGYQRYSTPDVDWAMYHCAAASYEASLSGARTTS